MRLRPIRAVMTSRRVLWIALILAASFFCYASVVRIPRVTHGFAMYYAYARLVIDGEDFTKSFDPEYFNSKLRAYGIVGITDVPNNPPTAAFAMMPLAWLRPEAAKTVWGICSILFVALSVRLLLHIYGISLAEDLGLGVMILVLLWKPLYAAIELGQIYPLLLLLFTLSLGGMEKQRRLLTAFPVSASIVLKGYGIIPLLWFALEKRWKLFGWTLLGISVLVAVSLAVFSPNVWLMYFTIAGHSLGRNPSDAHVAYQTINGFLRHLFSYNERWSPYPLLDIPEAALITASILCNLLLIVFVLRRASMATERDTLLSYSALLAASVLAAPLAEEYHFVLFIPLAIGMSAGIFRSWKSEHELDVKGVVFLVALLLMIFPLGYKGLNASPFPLVLVAYPKLYSGLAMILVFGLQSRGRPTTDELLDIRSIPGR